jgi:hypothetical protein
MHNCQSALRLDRASPVYTLDDGLKSRLLIGVLQVALAAVFVPIVLLILASVGVFMIFEWCVYHVGAAIQGDAWLLRQPRWERLGRPRNEMAGR